jgi:hypothetical protein
VNGFRVELLSEGQPAIEEEANLKKLSFLALAIGLVSSSASAMPLVQSSATMHVDNFVNVKIVCEPDGRCFHRGRRPIARWVYGEDVFRPTYVGPGYYGNPGRHSIWWPSFFEF